MMPPPEEIALLVDQAELIFPHGPLSKLPSEEKRRMLAAAIFDVLRERADGREMVEAGR